VKVRCIIVEDEPLAQKVLEKYISSLSTLKLVKKCNNALEAVDFLQCNSVDVIFLDIKMPELTGLDFLKTLSNPPKVIITTAYPEYALEGYKYSVVDYLLKPFSFERFLKAVNKLSPVTPAASTTIQETVEDFIFIKEDKIRHKVFFSDIIYIEGYGNYLKIYTDKKMILTAETMTNIERRLPANRFIRVHKSFIISIKKIDQIEGNVIKIASKEIPIGKYYKMNVEEMLKKFNLKNES